MFAMYSASGQSKRFYPLPYPERDKVVANILDKLPNLLYDVYIEQTRFRIRPRLHIEVNTLVNEDTGVS